MYIYIISTATSWGHAWCVRSYSTAGSLREYKNIGLEIIFNSSYEERKKWKNKSNFIWFRTPESVNQSHLGYFRGATSSSDFFVFFPNKDEPYLKSRIHIQVKKIIQHSRTQRRIYSSWRQVWSIIAIQYQVLNPKGRKQALSSFHLTVVLSILLFLSLYTWFILGWSYNTLGIGFE